MTVAVAPSPADGDFNEGGPFAREKVIWSENETESVWKTLRLSVRNTVCLHVRT